MRGSNRKTAGMIFGLITAAVLVVSQLCCYQQNDFNKKEQKTEESGTVPTHDGENIFIVAANSTISSIQTQIHQEIIFLFEILFLDNEQQSWTTEVPIALGKYFRTLFHIIISPNAP
jgi:hypothetical protein